VAGVKQSGHKRQAQAAAPLALDPQPRITIRVDLGTNGAIGPGKIRLMELISQHGSIAAAGKAMGMSYRRAWLLVDALNQLFREPLIAKQTGGSGGGGARLTKLGRDVVGRYRAIEGAAATASAADLRALKSSLAEKARAPE
jgi:molybdate transport system regulatory protein